MAKKKTWFNSLKEIFHSNPKSKSEKEEKRRRWLLGRLKPRPTPALIAPPPPPPPSPLEQKAFSEAEQQQSKHALAVAAATAAAAEAAVFAARVAQEVVRLTATPQPLRQSQDMAALRIQTAFRGYLARRALRALKALVRLQAIVRGRAVRRQTTTALKSLQSLMKIQSQVRTNRVRLVEERMQSQAETKQSPDMNASLKQSNQRKWDDRTLSKERTDALYQNRRETALKRECISKERTNALYQNRRAMMGYVSSYQEKRTPHRPNTPVEQEPEPENQRWIWLERWVDEQPWKRDFADISSGEQHHRLSEPPPCLVSLRGALEVEGTEFGRQRLKCKSVKDDDSFSSSPAVVPNYMVATESAKAKYRSTSTPRQRVGTTDGCSDWWPHCNFKHSNFPSMSSDASTFSKIWRTPSSYQRSPQYLKGSSGPMKACQNSRSISVGFDQ